MVTLASDNPVSDDVRAAVGEAIDAFLDEQAGVLSGLSPTTAPLLKRARMFTSGGKRLRPAFALWAWTAITGQTDLPDPMVRAAASLDVLHVSALMHDDVMDASDARRGVPAAHRQFEADHRDRGWRGDAEAFGRAGGILLGDLLLVWSEQMMSRSGLHVATLERGRPIVEAMRSEVTCGQFLDVIAQSAPESHDLEQALERANRIVEFKTNRYTVQRPLQFGAALGGATAVQLDQLAAFASPIGRAFQFRDDLLGVFGDQQLTGKPAGDDLREGKRTVLVAHALAKASAAASAELESMLGNEALDAAQVERAREIIVTSGARDAVENTIEAGYAQAMDALSKADVTEEGRVALGNLATASVRRAF